MPTESLYPPPQVPDASIFDFLFSRNDREFPGSKTIYTDSVSGATCSFDEVRTRAIDFSIGLRSQWSWNKGDVLAIFSTNSIDFPPIIWGTLCAGGIISPANPAYGVEELAYQLKDSGAKALAVQKPFLKVAQDAATQAGIPSNRIILMGDERDDSGSYKHWTSIKKISGTDRYRKAKVDAAKDTAFLVYSSGTTGRPKGVILTHRNIVANVLQSNTVEGAQLNWRGGQNGTGDRILGFLPFFHIYGLTCLLHQAAYQGWNLVVMPKFSIENFCSTVQNYRITFAYVVPPVVLLLSQHPVVNEYDLSSLRMMNSGAAPLTRELVEAVYKRIKVPVKQGYGLSETSPTTHSQPWEHWDRYIGSVGPLFPGMTAKYMSVEEQELPVGQTGELWLKGPNVFRGYHNNAEATSNALTSDGYFKTGDVGHQDDKGNFFITDRVKELIKYKGFQVAPAELEGLLVTHTTVADAAVIGIEDRGQATELPRAYIVAKQGVQRSEATSQEIMSWIEQRVAAHKRLRGGVKFVDEIPKSASGKILRRLLKEKAANEAEPQGRQAKL